MRWIAPLAATLVLVGCGGETESDGSSAGGGDDPTVSSAPPEASDTQEELYNATAAVGLSKSSVDAFRYCARKTGARIGVEAPPSRALISAKNAHVRLVKRVVKNFPGMNINGQSLDDYLSDQVASFRETDCDPKLAAAIEDAALELP